MLVSGRVCLNKMVDSITLEHCVKGTLDQFSEAGRYPITDEEIYATNWNLSSGFLPPISDFHRRLSGNIRLSHLANMYNSIEMHLIPNASDSVVERALIEGPSFEVEVGLRACYNPESDLYQFEIEDNGMGIDPKVELFLFSGRMGSKKKRDKRMIGGGGEGLSIVLREVTFRGGHIDYVNKGLMQGAKFWYSVPLKKR